MRKPLSGVPSKVQLPGGIVLSPQPFLITSYDMEGRPLVFELLPPGAKEGDCWLFAQTQWIRSTVKRPEPQVVDHIENAWTKFSLALDEGSGRGGERERFVAVVGEVVRRMTPGPFTTSPSCQACSIEAEIGTEENPHPVPNRFHTCRSTP